MANLDQVVRHPKRHIDWPIIAVTGALMVLGLLLVHVVLWVAVVPCGCCRCMWEQEEQEGQEDKKKGD